MCSNFRSPERYNVNDNLSNVLSPSQMYYGIHTCTLCVCKCVREVEGEGERITALKCTVHLFLL